jgi:hypothetical protein
MNLPKMQSCKLTSLKIQLQVSTTNTDRATNASNMRRALFARRAIICLLYANYSTASPVLF